VGWRVGFSFQEGAAYNVVQNSEATKLAIGIFFNGSTHHNKALNNRLTDNHAVWELTLLRTLGAMGVLVHGDSQEIGFNYFAGNKSLCTYTGDIESNSIELYAATNVTIHHNTSFGDRVFSEMGSSPLVTSNNNAYAYNLHVASISDSNLGARFLVTRGGGHLHGPVLRTKVYNNTVYLTSRGSKGVVCERCRNNILTLENNILWVNREPFSGDGAFVERNNIFWAGGESILMNLRGFALNDNSHALDPQFVDAANANFNLVPHSPAVNQATLAASTLGYDFDLWHTSTLVGGATDIGAFEYRQEPWERVFEVPGRIEAEDYHSGGSGSGFADTTSRNWGGEYRDDAVDIQTTHDHRGKFNVGWIDANEWLAYEINVSATGVYYVIVRAATPLTGRKFHVEIDGVWSSGSTLIPWTGSWQSWVDVPIVIPITAGRHSLKLVAETDKFNVNYIKIDKLQ
jgi:hypothetical protein